MEDTNEPMENDGKNSNKERIWSQKIDDRGIRNDVHRRMAPWKGNRENWNPHNEGPHKDTVDIQTADIRDTWRCYPVHFPV